MDPHKKHDPANSFYRLVQTIAAPFYENGTGERGMNYLLALSIPLTWALSIIASRFVVTVIDPLWANAFLFLIMGAIGSVQLVSSKDGRIPWRASKLPALAAAMLYCCLLMSSMAVLRTTIAKTVFYSTLYVIFIPLINALFLGKRYRPSFLLVLGLALLGAAFMADFSLAQYNSGDALATASAVFYALYVIVIENIARDKVAQLDTSKLVSLQSIFIAFIAVIAVSLWGNKISLDSKINNMNALSLPVAAFCSLVALRYLAYWIQARVQTVIHSHILGVLVIMDAPIGSGLAFFIFHEPVPLHTAIGGATVTCAALLAPWLGGCES
jgi:drug/metabolite transporter (DMT)-like permease